jgi:hypothetical protein
LLLLGSIFISFEKRHKATKDYLKIILVSSLMFSLDYIFQKKIFLDLTFLQGLIYIRILMFFFALFFLFSDKDRIEVFKKRKINNDNKKAVMIFMIAQVSGGIANVLQSFSISLVPIYFLPIINSLRGIQYIFLFLMTLFLTMFFPKILKENISRKIIIQKIISIILIVSGLSFLVF